MVHPVTICCSPAPAPAQAVMDMERTLTAPAPVTDKSPAASAKRPAQATTTKPSVKKHKTSSAPAPGESCEVCKTDIAGKTPSEKKQKGMCRDLYYMDMLCGGVPTEERFEWTTGKRTFVLPGWKINSNEVDKPKINGHIAALAQGKDVPNTWEAFKAMKAKSGALCLHCWNQKCAAAGLQVRKSVSRFVITDTDTSVCAEMIGEGGVSVPARVEYQYQRGWSISESECVNSCTMNSKKSRNCFF